MISCVERREVRERTLKSLTNSDWGEAPLHLQIDGGKGDNHKKRQTHCAFLALKKTLERHADFILFLEDDLEFNRHIRHNLRQWGPVKSGSRDFGKFVQSASARTRVRCPESCPDR